MPRAARAFLAWIMVLVMPLQGMAATLMLSCGPGHHRPMAGEVFAAPAAVARPTVHDHDHDHAAGDHPLHGHATAAHPGAHEVDAADPDSPSSRTPPHGKFSCSACAACCSALALPAGFALPEPSSPERFLRTAPVEPVASPPPDGLDRPPRTDLA